MRAAHHPLLLDHCNWEVTEGYATAPVHHRNNSASDVLRSVAIDLTPLTPSCSLPRPLPYQLSPRPYHFTQADIEGYLDEPVGFFAYQYPQRFEKVSRSSARSPLLDRRLSSDTFLDERRSPRCNHKIIATDDFEDCMSTDVLLFEEKERVRHSPFDARRHFRSNFNERRSSRSAFEDRSIRSNYPNRSPRENYDIRLSPRLSEDARVSPTPLGDKKRSPRPFTDTRSSRRLSEEIRSPRASLDIHSPRASLDLHSPRASLDVRKPRVPSHRSPVNKSTSTSTHSFNPECGDYKNCDEDGLPQRTYRCNTAPSRYYRDSIETENTKSSHRTTKERKYQTLQSNSTRQKQSFRRPRKYVPQEELFEVIEDDEGECSRGSSTRRPVSDKSPGYQHREATRLNSVMPHPSMNMPLLWQDFYHSDERLRMEPEPGLCSCCDKKVSYCPCCPCCDKYCPEGNMNSVCTSLICSGIILFIVFSPIFHYLVPP